MRDFFSLDGPFNKYGGMIADMIILSLMWLLFSLLGLGLTIGASTSAMFFVSTRRIANREGYITSDFWMAFKANFKKATQIWLIILVLVWLIWFNLNNIEVVGGLQVIIFPAQIVLLAEIGLMSVYLFPMNARFDMGLKQLFKSSFYMANRHLLTSVSCLCLLIAAVLSFFIMPPLALFLAPGAYAWLSSYMIMKIFKKYRPEMDKDPVLEIQEIEAQKELERRQQRFKSMKKDNDGEAPDENDAFWAVQESDEMAAESIGSDEDAEDKGDIWTQLREAGDLETKEPDAINAVQTVQKEVEAPITAKKDDDAPITADSIFGDENNEEDKRDIWAKLRDAGNSEKTE